MSAAQPVTIKPLPIGTPTFPKIIEGGFLYVDKTELIYELVRDSTGVFFLARPRRFGKSLLLSTLAELFRGNRELFRGLWIDQSDYGRDRRQAGRDAGYTKHAPAFATNRPALKT